MGAWRHICASHVLAVHFISVLKICSAVRDRPDNFALLPKWNDSLNYSLFRNERVAQYFDVWPENSTGLKFTYSCEDPATSTQSLSNFTYNLTDNRLGGRLDPRPYYDLGIVDNFAQPYWKHWQFWTLDTRTHISYPINCEYYDLQALYAYRFWHMPVFQGFRAFLVMQGVVMFVVFISMTLRWRGVEMEAKDKKWKNVHCWFWAWSRDWGHFFSELIHLGLVVEMGYCMMEAVGHSDLRSWRALVMYNAGVVYTWLTLFAVLSSIIRQITNGWPTEKEELDQKNKCLSAIQFLRLRRPVEIEPTKWFSIQAISDDWRWQRVFAQLGTLILVGTYLTFVDDASGTGMDQMAGLVLAAAVVACIWSFGVPAVVLFRFIRVLVLASVDTYKLEKKAKGPEMPVSTKNLKEGSKRQGPGHSLLRQTLTPDISPSESARPPNTPSPRHRVYPIIHSVD